MRAFDRLFAIIVGLILLAFGILLLGASLQIGQDTIHAWVQWLYADRLVSLIAFLVLGLLAAYMFAMGFRRPRSYESIQYTTPLGEVRISVRAIEDLAFRAARKIKGVREAEVMVKHTPTGVTLYTEIGVNPDVSIPEVTNEIRSRLESYVRETAGVTVSAVDVTVKRISADVRSRVE